MARVAEWQNLPTSILAEDTADLKAKSWADGQRAVATKAWADAARQQATAMWESRYPGQLPQGQPDPNAGVNLNPRPPMDATDTLGPEAGIRGQEPESEPGQEPFTPEVPSPPMFGAVRGPFGAMAMPFPKSPDISKPTEDEGIERRAREGRAPVENAEQAFGALTKHISRQGEALPGAIADMFVPNSGSRRVVGELGDIGTTMVKQAGDRTPMYGPGADWSRAMEEAKAVFQEPLTKAEPPPARGSFADPISEPPTPRGLEPGMKPPRGPGAPWDTAMGTEGGIPPRGASVATRDVGFSTKWDRARNVTEKMGPSGRVLGGQYQTWRNASERLAGPWEADVKTMRDLPDKWMENFVDVVEGKAAPINERVAKAAAEATAVFADVRERAVKAGLKIGKVDNYFPHMFPNGTFEGKGFNDAVQHLVATKQANSEAEAVEMLRKMQETRRNRRFGNLETERQVDLPGYLKTKAAVLNYLESSANRITQVEQFGETDEKALAQIAKIGKEGGDATEAQRLYDIVVGAKTYPEIDKNYSGFARGLQAVTKLGLSGISNLGQPTNIATVTGFVNTAKGLSRGASKEGWDLATRAGVVLDQTMASVRDAQGIGEGIIGKVTAPGFTKVEGWNRVWSFHSGGAFAEEQAKNAVGGSRRAMRALTGLGLDASVIVARGGKLTEDEMITAGRKIVERTQFKVDPQDLPGWAASPWARIAWQFKTFGYNQSAFVGREIIAPALQGDVRPLVAFIVAGGIVGYPITELKDTAAGREGEKNWVKKVIQVYGNAGGGGLLADFAIRNIAPIADQKVQPDSVALRAAGAVLGPSFSTGADIFKASSSAIGHEDWKPAGRLAARQAPVIGPALASTLFPYGKGGGSKSSVQTVPSRQTSRPSADRSRSSR